MIKVRWNENLMIIETIQIFQASVPSYYIERYGEVRGLVEDRFHIFR